MFDKEFFKYALGFLAIILLSLGAIYIAENNSEEDSSTQTTLSR